ncbi:MAG: alcohol dehydrogenase catalytic domain-containing protein [Chloroflexi bacterium]|nr:alcohol dehydrogenase catalytic domain-containing protein [Chloroflexota bacterium]
MLGVGMVRGKPSVHGFDVHKPEIQEADDVLVRVKEVGLDGTDFNMLRSGDQDIAPGRDKIVLGHELLGVVEVVGSKVTSVSPGDLVTMTVRRGCGECEPCMHNQSDMCLTGRFTERGIHKVDGFLTPYVVDKEQYVIKVPGELRQTAIFTEPLSIAEKGMEQLRVIQSRLKWSCPHPNHDFLEEDWGGCKTALVVGAGQLGLLATALLRLAGAYIYTADVLPDDTPKAALVKRMDANYLDARDKTPDEIVDLCCTFTGTLDIIFEASGAAETAVRLIPHMSRGSIYVMTGIPRGDLNIEIDAAQLVRQVVRYNQVIVGSVNSNRKHFEMALKDMRRIDSQFGGILQDMATHRFRLEDYQRAFSLADPNHIKTVIEVEPW